MDGDRRRAAEVVDRARDALAEPRTHTLADVAAETSLDDAPELVDVERRAGMAYGEVLVREGDYVGTTVNTAARLTDLAHPGSLVVTDEASEALNADWQRSRLPPKRLKGLPTDRHVRIRWPEDPDVP